MSTSNTKLKVIIIVAVTFFGLSLIQFPRGPQFNCGPRGENGGKYQIQYGFPFVFVKRSVSPSACTFADERMALPGETNIQKYDHGRIEVLGLAGDLIIWFLATELLLWKISAIRKTK